MPIAITDEQHAIRASIRDWATATNTVADVRAREHGADKPRWWSELTDLGMFAIGVPEPLGGVGGDLVDVAVAVEQAAESLVPGPVLPTVLAAQLTLTDGKATAGLALPGLTAVPAPDGGLLVHGTTLVLGAGEADHLLLTADDKWFLADGLPTTPTTPLDFSRSLATIHADGLHIRPDRLLPNADRIPDLAVTLAVAEAAGVAGWCLRTATDYARTREQFGRPIGSFQAIKHLCADMLCRVEQAVALAWDAARAYADGPAQHSIATAAAAAIAFDAAVDNAKDCIQILGGIGFTWEHDAHLYLRRALALRQLFGGGPCWRQRTARLALSGARRDHTVHISTDRTEIRATVATIAARPPAEYHIALAETGYLTPHWPKPYGTAATPAEQLAIDDELAAAGIHRPDLVIGGWAAPTILRHGTPAQCARFIAPTLRGDITWCQLFSEPDAGSDLASLRTRADRVPDGWRLTGQKVWTSLATKANWAICLARTDPTAPKHRGISYFLVDMRSDGIDIRPLREITGDAVFNEVFLDNVFVPDDCLVGPENGGWQLARTTLANERVAMSRGSTLGDAMEHLLAMTHDPADHERLGALTAQGMATSLLDLRTTIRALDGRAPGAESSVRKLIGVAHRQAVAEATLDLLGHKGAVTSGSTHEFLLTRCLTIAGGTTQVLRTLAAEHLLGLPREPR